MKSEMIVRYSLLATAVLDHPRMQSNILELASSLASLARHVRPHLNVRLVIKTSEPLQDCLQGLCRALGFRHWLVAPYQKHQLEFGEMVRSGELTDQLCVARFLADFEDLPTDRFRLLVGNDCHFLAPPLELIEFVRSGVSNRMLYAVDTHTWGGVRYRLKHFAGPTIPGLLGDFYCLAPGVTLSPDEIIGTVRMIDAWPPDRWIPDLPGPPRVHALDQQAAAILLTKVDGQELDPVRYSHWCYTSSSVMAHAKDRRFLSSLQPKLSVLRWLYKNGLLKVYLSDYWSIIKPKLWRLPAWKTSRSGCR
jgi:hypothetical protein